MPRRFFARSGEHDPHVILECKRVAEGDARLAREYVVEGIDRFRTSKYAENHRRGFMIGYLVSGNEQGVVDAVNRYLARCSRHAEALVPSATGLATTGWESEHPRRGRSDSAASRDAGSRVAATGRGVDSVAHSSEWRFQRAPATTSVISHSPSRSDHRGDVVRWPAPVKTVNLASFRHGRSGVMCQSHPPLW